MSARFSTLIGNLLAAGTIALTGCSSSGSSTVVWEDSGLPCHNPTSRSKNWKYKFVYFPGEDVYFEPYTSTYYWFDGDFWYEGAELPNHIHIGLVEPQVVRLHDNKPYMSHGTVVAKHFGTWKTVKPGATDVSFYGGYQTVGWESQGCSDFEAASMCGGEQFMPPCQPLPTCDPSTCDVAREALSAESPSDSSTPQADNMTTMAEGDLDN